jgi:hypothetical protein
MSTNLTALTERQIAAEEALTHAGFLQAARTARWLYNQADTTYLDRIIRANVRTAARAVAQPQRFVVPAGEPLPMEAADMAAHFLTQAAIAGCRTNAERAGLFEERRRREVD